jgi:hypothetical protein
LKSIQGDRQCICVEIFVFVGIAGTNLACCPEPISLPALSDVGGVNVSISEVHYLLFKRLNIERGVAWPAALYKRSREEVGGQHVGSLHDGAACLLVAW